ncbi:MAG TPA: hypothetical protein VM580_18740 [Labilithrix sp.]|nr:hypothetical protein [Labilithrix sp.]
MKHASLLVLLPVLLLAASCQQTLGIEKASPICPPELPECTPCERTEDCGSGTECHAWTCKDSVCTPINAEPMTDCSTGVCSDDPVSVCSCSEDRTCSAP